MSLYEVEVPVRGGVVTFRCHASNATEAKGRAGTWAIRVGHSAPLSMIVREISHHEYLSEVKAAKALAYGH